MRLKRPGYRTFRVLIYKNGSLDKKTQPEVVAKSKDEAYKIIPKLFGFQTGERFKISELTELDTKIRKFKLSKKGIE
jgi:hypothetical protein